MKTARSDRGSSQDEPIFSLERSNFEWRGSQEETSDGVHWRNKYQHLFAFLSYCMSYRTFHRLTYEEGSARPDFISSTFQTVIVYIIVGGPLVFLQHFIGQFTSKSCIALGSMLPALHGFGYCMLVLSILECSVTLYYAGADIIYLLMTFVNFPQVPWMVCTDDFYEVFPDCFSIHDIDSCTPCSTGTNKTCLESKNILAAKVFKFLVVFEEDPFLKEITLQPRFRRSLHTFATMLAVFVVSTKKIIQLDWFLRLNVMFCFLSSSAAFMIIFSHGSALQAIKNSFYATESRYFDIKVWLSTVNRVTESLKISLGGNFLLGAYMTRDTPSHFRVCYLLGFSILLVSYSFINYFLFEKLLECTVNAKDVGINSPSSIGFVLIPTIIGLTATPQLWATLYFLAYWISAVMTMTMDIALVEEALSNEFNIGHYYLYTRSALCFAVFLLCLPLTSLAGAVLIRIVKREIKLMNLLFICITFVIMFMYNIQRFKDDIHFVIRSPPTWYIQTCWIITAFMAAAAFGMQSFYYKIDNKFYYIRLPIYIMVGAPILIGFFAQLTYYIRKRNVTAIFRAAISYGPPDLEMRMMRLLFNPRLEVRYRRRMEVCKHRCLLKKDIAASALESELVLLEQMALDLESHISTKKEYEDIITELRQHRRVLNIRYLSLMDPSWVKNVMGRTSY